MRAGWRDGFPEWAEPRQWTDSFLQRYEDCKAEDSLASTAQEQVGSNQAWPPACLSSIKLIFRSWLLSVRLPPQHLHLHTSVIG